MKLLLDTHAYIWWALDERGLSMKAKRTVTARAAQVYFSAVSAYEMAYKHVKATCRRSRRCYDASTTTWRSAALFTCPSP